MAENWTSNALARDDLSLGTIHRDLREHPALPAAVRTLCASQLEIADRRPDLGELYLDAGRYVSAMLAIYSGLEHGLKLARFQADCRDSLWMSPGRARSHLQLLQHMKYLEQQGERLSTTYYVTDRFRQGWIAHYRAALCGAAVIEPAAAVAAAQLDDPAVFREFMDLHVSALLDGPNHIDLDPSVAKAFMHPYAGSQLTGVIMTSGEASCFPPREFALPSISQLSKRFRVSRTHIKRLFANAAGAGMIAEISPGRWSLSEAAAAGLTDLFRSQLACLIHASVAAMGRQEESRRRPAGRTAA